MRRTDHPWLRPYVREHLRETVTVSATDRDAGQGKPFARSYDFVVVGAGSAGCVVARRLVDAGATVLLVEAGGRGGGSAGLTNPPLWVENIGSRYDWAYRYEPSPHVAGRSIPLALGKVLGGSGSINGMLWARGNGADYDGWAAAGNPGWDFRSVLPLFKKSEDWEDGARSCGQEPGKPGGLGYFSSTRMEAT
jgi:choline dehydrogenase